MQRMMRTMGVLAAALVLGVGTMAAQGHNWAIDKSHSEADFSTKQNGNTVNGSFRGVTGTIRFEAGNPNVWSVDATIDLNSLDTGAAQSAQALESPQFFDVARYPTATFKSTSVKAKDAVYHIAGNLTLHGVTKPVTLTMDPPAAEQVGMDATRVHCRFTASATINPRDFGLTSDGGAAVGNEINIKLNIEALRE